MAAFDTALEITNKTLPVPDDGRSIKLAEGGQVRGRNAYARTVWRMNVVIVGTVAIRDALTAFYDTNKDDLNTLSIDGIDFEAMFTSKPYVTEKDGYIRWIEFGLLGYEV